MIFSIILVILLIFIFFWALQCHKQSEYEYYQNTNLTANQIEAGAEVIDNQMRGKRRLAYPISKHKEGIYVQLSHNGDGQQVAVLERAMRLSEDDIRYLTVIQEGPLPTPRTVASNETSSSEESKEEKEENTEAKEDSSTSK